MRKALFIDRDGVINVDKGYVGRIEDFDFIPGVFEGLRYAMGLGYRLVVVTNQSGIARGRYTEEDYLRLRDWMTNALEAQGVQLQGVYHCPYHPQGVVSRWALDSDLRKPKPGMLLKAAKEHGLSLAKSVMLGDQETDILAGIAAGVRQTILVSTDPGVDTQATHVIGSIAQLPLVLNETGELA